MVRLAILLLSCCSLTLWSATVDVFVDFEASTAGTLFTPAILTNGSHGTTGPWSAYPSSPFEAATVGSNNLTTANFLVTAGGVTYQGAGTRGFNFDHTVTISGTDTAMIDFPGDFGAITNVSMGAFVKFDARSPDADLYAFDHLVIQGEDNAYCVCQQWRSGTTNYIQAHADNGSTTRGPHIQVQTNHLYWLTVIRNATNGLCTVKLYDAEGGMALVGTSDSSMRTNGYSYQFHLGNNFPSTAAGRTQWDNLVIDWTTAQFPLLPLAVPYRHGRSSRSLGIIP